VSLQRASLVNVTQNMRYKNDKKILNSSSPDLFLQDQNAQNRFWPGLCPTVGELTTLPKPSSRLGGNTPPHSPPPRRRTQRLGSQAPSTQIRGYRAAYQDYVPDYDQSARYSARARPHGTASPSNCGLYHCLPRRLQKKLKIIYSAASASEDSCLTGAILICISIHSFIHSFIHTRGIDWCQNV